MTGETVSRFLGILVKVLVHLTDERLLRVVHTGDVMATTASGVVTFNHLLMNGFTHFFTLSDLLFRGAQRTLDFTDQGIRTCASLIKEKHRVVERPNVFVGVIQQMAVGATSRSTRGGLKVLSLLIGSIGGVHRVAEFATELIRTSPVNNAGQRTNEDNTDDCANEEHTGDVPFGIFHFLYLYVVLLKTNCCA